MMNNLSLSLLQKLVASFVNEASGYVDFRQRFVLEFGSIRSDDSGVESAITFVESLCADRDEGDISEVELRSVLSRWLDEPIVTVEVDGKVSSAKSAVNRHSRVDSGSWLFRYEPATA